MTFGIQEIVGLLLLGGAVGGFLGELIRTRLARRPEPNGGASPGILRTMLDDQAVQRGEWRSIVDAELKSTVLWRALIEVELKASREREAVCVDHYELCNQQLDSLRVQVTLLEQWRDAHLRQQGLPPYDETLPGTPA